MAAPPACCVTSRGEDFSLGADLGQGATDIRVIAANVIVAETYYRREECYRDAGAVSHGSRMGKPEDRA
jgi:hypothetical protein